jgi:hypothetical protein
MVKVIANARPGLENTSLLKMAVKYQRNYVPVFDLNLGVADGHSRVMSVSSS